MPKITLPFASEDLIPSQLLPYKSATDNSVTMWVGEETIVAGELNPSLAKNHDDLLNEKKKVDKKYNDLLTSTSNISTELNETKLALANNTGVSPEDLTLLKTVKPLIKDIPIEQVKERIEKYPEVLTENNQVKIDKSFGDFFKATGYKNEAVLKDLVKDAKGFEVVKGKDAQQKEIDIPTVLVEKEGKIEKVALSDFKSQNPNWDAYTPALMNGEVKQTNQTWLNQNTSHSEQSLETGVSLTNSIVTAMNAKNAPQPATIPVK